MKKINILLLTFILFVIFVLSSCTSKYYVGNIDSKDISTIEINRTYYIGDYSKYKNTASVLIDFKNLSISNNLDDEVIKLSHEEVQDLLNIFDDNKLFKYPGSEKKDKNAFYEIIISTTDDKTKLLYPNPSSEWILEIYKNVPKLIGYDLYGLKPLISNALIYSTICFTKPETIDRLNALECYNGYQNGINYSYGKFIKDDINMFDYVDDNQRHLKKEYIYDSCYINLMIKMSFVRFTEIVVKQYSIDKVYDGDIVLINHNITPSELKELGDIVVGNFTFSAEINKYYYIYFEDYDSNWYEFMVSTVTV